MSKVYLILGSNIGNRRFYIQKAIDKISLLGFNNIRVSSFFETEPWGVSHQMSYYNVALEMEYPQKPFQLMNKLKKIEKQLGRKEKGKYLPRTIDIDVILWGNMLIDSNSLQIPHPRMQDRNFVLTPLIELNPKLFHPILQKKISDLQLLCKDSLVVKKIEFR
ncbi:MAG: 2-amino-4-hydroxy-6-hydroxymethyldihydropteridine diphosphokinase [Bacteroidetes bacterium]|nr:2-amino-4-hydroxy-6-hydroxymethyldihydropteridine diphosphokinase [Bacteroidota bacterium]MBK7139366.1 2-amino-4-hydroxy-6-hydroxymethyldihydropteridine diphosphokinase [Bacteroidota bacterium]